MEKIICNIQQLRNRLRGNKDCTLMISRSCEIDINKMPYEDYLILKPPPPLLPYQAGMAFITEKVCAM